MKADQILETIESTGTKNSIFHHFVLLFCAVFLLSLIYRHLMLLIKQSAITQARYAHIIFFLFYLFLKYIAKPHWRQQKSEISHFSFFSSIRTLEGLFISSKHGSDGDNRPTNRPRNKKCLQAIVKWSISWKDENI